MDEKQLEIIFNRHFSFWDRLNKEEKNTFYNNVSSLHLEANQSMHGGKEDCMGVVLVLKGQLRTYMLSEGGKDITLYRLFENDTCILSASCVLETITFDVFIDAQEECDLLLINSGLFMQLAKNNVYIELFANKLAVERFSDVMWAMQQILFKSFDERLADFLLSEMRKQNSNELKITHEQIAKYIGSAREVVTRMLKYFSSEEIVTLSRGGIKILNKEKLIAITHK